MTRRPTRATPGGRAYLELRKLARERQRPTAELLQLYALEGFLARLAQSSQARRFVLKGGVLLAAYRLRRPTKDVDLAATGLINDPGVVHAAIRDVLGIALDDGLEFDLASTAARTIREEGTYSGVRVTVPCTLASARVDFHVDINLGDPIDPPATTLALPRILGGEPLSVTGYSISMVLAEKIVTAMERGAANTRWRDFADIFTLMRRHTVEAEEARRSMLAVARYRGVTTLPLRTVLAGFERTAQPKWTTWRRRLGLETELPEAFGDLLREIESFVDPLLGTDELNAVWRPEASRWDKASGAR